MLKKRFYDIVSGVGLVAIVSFLILISGKKEIINSMNQSMFIIQLSLGVISIICWLFILILSLELHSEKLIKIYDVILTAILIPLAAFSYLAFLRTPLQKWNKKNYSRIHKFQNIPGTP